RRSEHAIGLAANPQPVDEVTRIGQRALPGSRLDDSVDKGNGRRILHSAAEGDFVLVERVVVLPARMADAVMVRIQRLDDRFTLNFSPSGTPRDLRQQLKGSLRGAEIGEPETHIRGN